MHSKLKRLIVTTTIGLTSFMLAIRFYCPPKFKTTWLFQIVVALCWTIWGLGSRVGYVAYNLFLTGKVRVVHNIPFM